MSAVPSSQKISASRSRPYTLVSCSSTSCGTSWAHAVGKSKVDASASHHPIGKFTASTTAHTLEAKRHRSRQATARIRRRYRNSVVGDARTRRFTFRADHSGPLRLGAPWTASSALAWGRSRYGPQGVRSTAAVPIVPVLIHRVLKRKIFFTATIVSIAIDASVAAVGLKSQDLACKTHIPCAIPAPTLRRSTISMNKYCNVNYVCSVSSGYGRPTCAYRKAGGLIWSSGVG